MGNSPSSFSEILAKEDETLGEHTENSIQFLLKFFGWQKENLKRIAQASRVEVNELKSRLFATVYLHDIGKANVDFQARMHGERKKDIPHALLSLPFIFSAVPPLEEVHVESLALISHHTPFYSELYEDYKRAASEEKYCLPFALEFYCKITEVHSKELGYEYPFSLKEPPLEDLGKCLKKVKEFYLFETAELREVFSFFVTALHYADWLASGHQQDYKFSRKIFLPDIEKSFHYTGKLFGNWHQFQRDAGKIAGSIFIRIPTGKGKTEAAFHWIERNVTEGKVIYLLPTRVTSNAMYLRLKDYFRDDVGVAHGSSSLVIAEERGWGTESYRSEKLLSETFMKPITICTVDQLLLAKFNWYHWELIEQNTASGACIFDEIHAYEPYTLSLILHAMEELREKGARFAILSATLPSYVEESIRDILGDVPVIEEPGFDAECRHRIYYKETPIEEATKAILAGYAEKQRILVIVNTVEKAMQFFKKIEYIGNLTEEDCVLYHSRFTEMHRREKEDRIEAGADKDKGFIAVTTQVVEVSLDIDYDILYTELAPVDALIQRMGRANRKGEKGIVPVFVYSPGEESSKVYGDDNICRADRIIRRINEKEIQERLLRELVEEQYPKEDMNQILLEEREEVEREFNSLRHDLWQIQTLQLSSESEALRKIAKTRRDKFPNIEVIPTRYQEEVSSLTHPLEVTKYLVRVPYYKAENSIVRSTTTSRFLYANLEYSPKYGVTGYAKGGVFVE